MQDETEKVMRTDTQKLVKDLRQLASDLEGGNYGEANKLVASAADKIDELVAAILHLADRWEEKIGNLKTPKSILLSSRRD